MKEPSLATASYIVRIYRADKSDVRRITGIVEPLDGSGLRTKFCDSDELASLLAQVTSPDGAQNHDHVDNLER